MSAAPKPKEKPSMANVMLDLARSCATVMQSANPELFGKTVLEGTPLLAASVALIEAFQKDEKSLQWLDKYGEDRELYSLNKVQEIAKAAGSEAAARAGRVSGTDLFPPKPVAAKTESTNITFTQHRTRQDEASALAKSYPATLCREAAIDEMTLLALNCDEDTNFRSWLEAVRQSLFYKVEQNNGAISAYSAAIAFLLILSGESDNKRHARFALAYALTHIVDASPVALVTKNYNWLATMARVDYEKICEGIKPPLSPSSFQASWGPYLRHITFPLFPLWWTKGQQLNDRMMIPVRNSMAPHGPPIAAGGGSALMFSAPPATAHFSASSAIRSDVLANLTSVGLGLSCGGASGAIFKVSSNGTIDLSDVERYCLQSRQLIMDLHAQLASLKSRLAQAASDAPSSAPTAHGNPRRRAPKSSGGAVSPAPTATSVNNAAEASGF